jgi:threonine dehydrogenase-like Zn-dependent dehydrogenase
VLNAVDTMRACVLTAPGELQLRTQPIPRPGARDVLVRVLATGVCGSDLATYRGTHPYKTAPTVLGHELCGVIERIGADVRTLEVGDLVCAASYSPCDACPRCEAGAPHLCPRKRSLSYEGLDGAFAEYVSLAENMTFRLPVDLDPAIGALVEPLSIATHALKLLGERRATLAIVGTGGIGLCTLLAARALGFGKIACLDIDPRKGRLALEHGADAWIDAQAPDGTARVQQALEADPLAVALCSGHHGALDAAATLAGAGGAIVVVSYFPDPQPIDVNAIVARELTVVGSALATPTDVTEVIGWLGSERLDPAGIIGRRHPLEELPLAMTALDHGAPGKTLIEVGSTSR